MLKCKFFDKKNGGVPTSQSPPPPNMITNLPLSPQAFLREQSIEVYCPNAIFNP